MEEKEERIRKITKLYYSNPKVQQILVDFARNREVVPRYFEGFGKRPDIIQYASDVTGLVNKGATSFHGSGEIWTDPLQLQSEMRAEEIINLRRGWDLLLDIDSPFLDCSKIAARLIVAALEQFGVNNYGIKFSGSKGLHIIVSGNAFPAEHKGKLMKEMFPEWPRAISEFLMNYIQKDYYREVGKLLSESDIAKRTNISKEELRKVKCLQCGRDALKGNLVKLYCPVCGMRVNRRDFKQTKRRLRCLNNCAGILEIEEERQYYYCDYCKDADNEKIPLSSDKYPESFEEIRGVNAEAIAKLDLVLVAPRHLFRMPYSLHEKTALASVVLTKEEINDFSPNDANPLKVKFREFMPQNTRDEARKLLTEALEWKEEKMRKEEQINTVKYSDKKYDNLEIKNVSEDSFPDPINKLLQGLKDGRKRGLFVLLTFLKCLNFSGDYINTKIREWNKKNDPPLKEGYVKSQIEWHLKQKKKILPPNYSNDSFYRDIGILEKKPDVKNPLVEVMRNMRKRN